MGFLIVLLMQLAACVVVAKRAFENASGVYSFGDSVLDAGNNNYLLVAPTSRCNEPPYGRIFDTMAPTGRFCDGELISDITAKELQLPFGVPYLDPNTRGEKLKQGVNFASGGAGILESTSRIQNVASLRTQLSWFRDYRAKLVEVANCIEANRIIQQGVYFVSFGANDYGLKNLNPEELTTDPATFEQRLIDGYVQFLKEVHEIGAKDFIIHGLGPLGCIPVIITQFNPVTRACVEVFNQLALSFNTNLQSRLVELENQLPGTNFTFLDVYGIMSGILQDPSQYGFTVTNRGCCGTGLFEFGVGTCNALAGACNNGSAFVYFDAAHLSFAANKIIAAQL